MTLLSTFVVFGLGAGMLMGFFARLIFGRNK